MNTEVTKNVPTQDELKQWISTVQDPELFMSIVDLGLIYRVEPMPEGRVEVDMTLTSPMCPASGYLTEQVQKRLMEHSFVEEVKVNVVFEPKWDPKTMASDEVKDKLGIW